MDTTESCRFSPSTATAPTPLQCEDARKNLAEKMKVFSRLHRYERFMYYALIPVSLAAGGWLYSGVSGPEELWVQAFGATVVYMVGWFFLIYTVHNVFSLPSGSHGRSVPIAAQRFRERSGSRFLAILSSSRPCPTSARAAGVAFGLSLEA